MRKKAKGGANCCGGNGTGCSQNSYEIATEYRKDFIKKHKASVKDAQRCLSCPSNDAGLCKKAETWCYIARQYCSRTAKEVVDDQSRKEE